jgi:hypothetical protein
MLQSLHFKSINNSPPRIVRKKRRPPKKSIQYNLLDRCKPEGSCFLLPFSLALAGTQFPLYWGDHYSSISTKSMLQYWAVATVLKSLYMESLLKYSYQIPDLVLGYGHNTQIPVYWGNHYSSIPTKSLTWYWVVVTVPSYLYMGSITQVSLPNPCSDIGLWAQYPNPCIWGNITQVSYQIPDQILGCGNSTQIPVNGETLLKYPY